MTAWLTDPEIAAICEPLVQPHAQAKALRLMGFVVKIKPNGHPLVARSNFEAVMGARHIQSEPQPAVEVPNEGALVLMFGRKGEKHGSKAQGKPARTA